jgi:hypothetical protein
VRRVALALFVAFHAAAVCASSLPSPGAGLERSNWSDPTVQGEFAAWGALLQVEPGALQGLAYRWARRVQRLRNAANLPFDAYLDLTNSRQSWKMFVAAHRHPTRAEIAVRPRGGTWTTVFRERDPVATWRAERFAHERVRAGLFAWGWPSGVQRWNLACRGFAAELFSEDGRVDEVRCQFQKRESPSHEQVLRGEIPPESPVFVRVVERE